MNSTNFLFLILSSLLWPLRLCASARVLLTASAPAPESEQLADRRFDDTGVAVAQGEAVQAHLLDDRGEEVRRMDRVGARVSAIGGGRAEDQPARDAAARHEHGV